MMWEDRSPITLAVHHTLVAAGLAPKDFVSSSTCIDMGYAGPDIKLYEVHGRDGPTHWVRVALYGLGRRGLRADYLIDLSKDREALLIHPDGDLTRGKPFFLKEFLVTTGLYDRADFSPPEDYDACLLYIGPERANANIYPWDKIPNDIRLAPPRPPRERPASPTDLRRELVDLRVRLGDNLLSEEEVYAQKRNNITNPDIFEALTNEAREEEIRRHREQHNRLAYLRLERRKIEQNIARVRSLLS